MRAGSPSYQVTDGLIFTCNSRGILRVWSQETGEMTKEARINGSYWATPIIADGHMYCFGDNGEFRLVDLHLGDEENRKSFRSLNSLRLPLTVTNQNRKYFWVHLRYPETN